MGTILWVAFWRSHLWVPSREKKLTEPAEDTRGSSGRTTRICFVNLEALEASKPQQIYTYFEEETKLSSNHLKFLIFMD